MPAAEPHPSPAPPAAWRDRKRYAWLLGLAVPTLPFAPRHSWNSNNTPSNIFLYQLQRHSDHHANPLRRYQTLRQVDEAPQLPSGYASMIVLARIPPLWRRVMDHRVLTHYAGEPRRANIRPGRKYRYAGTRGVRSTARAASGTLPPSAHGRER
ncbi:fatty acid desaturase [Streptomyces zhihengii]